MPPHASQNPATVPAVLQTRYTPVSCMCGIPLHVTPPSRETEQGQTTEIVGSTGEQQSRTLQTFFPHELFLRKRILNIGTYL